MEKVSIGANIRRIRTEACLSQAELARLVQISQSMLCQIERGTKACSMGLGAEIAKALKCDIADLISPPETVSA